MLTPTLTMFVSFLEAQDFPLLREPKDLSSIQKITSGLYLCLMQVFETCLSYWRYLLAVNSQIHVKTSSLKRANNVLKLPGIDYVAKNWALAMMLKALPLVHFWSVLLLKEQMMTSVRKTLKTLVWSAQNRSISSKICPENNQLNLPFFYRLLSGQVCPENYREILENRPIFPRFCP